MTSAAHNSLIAGNHPEFEAPLREYVAHAQRYKATTAIILGSGWKDIAPIFEIDERYSYSQIPLLGSSSVEGHEGEIYLARHETQRVLIFSGRRHLYEEDSLKAIQVPIYLSKMAGVEQLMLTNASGSLHADYTPGSLFLIRDHINESGVSILAGRHHPFWGERFPDMTCVYDSDLCQILLNCARELSIELLSGIYAAVKGPCYETPAEVRKLRAIGADAVGMSTVHEAVLAHAAGLRVCGLSCLSNLAAGLSEEKLTHREVLENSAKSRSARIALVSGFLRAVRPLPRQVSM